MRPVKGLKELDGTYVGDSINFFVPYWPNTLKRCFKKERLQLAPSQTRRRLYSDSKTNMLSNRQLMRNFVSTLFSAVKYGSIASKKYPSIETVAYMLFSLYGNNHQDHK